MPSPADFRRFATRRANRGAMMVTSGTLALTLLVITCRHLLDSPTADEWPVTVGLSFAALCVAGGATAFGVLFVLARHPCTRCPHCRKSLVWHVPLVVASHRCPHCGGTVLASPDPLPTESLIPRSDYVTADAGYQKVGVPVLLGGMFGTYLGVIGASGVIGLFRLPATAGIPVFAAGVVIPLVSVVGVMKWVVAWGKRTPGLGCPACGKLLAGARMLVAGTRRCLWCGTTVIAPRVRPLPPPHLAEPWELVALQKQRVERRRALWRAFRWLLVGVGLAVVAAVAAGVLFDLLSARGGPLPLLRRWEREQLFEVLVPAGLLLAGVAWWWLSGRVARRHSLPCPRCGREIAAAFAVATGCCNRCGWGILVCRDPQRSALPCGSRQTESPTSPSSPSPSA